MTKYEYKRPKSMLAVAAFIIKKKKIGRLYLENVIGRVGRCLKRWEIRIFFLSFYQNIWKETTVILTSSLMRRQRTTG